MILKNIVAKAFVNCGRRILKRNRSFFATTISVNCEHPKGQRGIMKDMKYILVTGGVISGVGKGVIASSFGTLLNCCGISVTSLKIDPYINIDAGTFSPYEHGKYIRNLKA